jgi:hypothetical protein
MDVPQRVTMVAEADQHVAVSLAALAAIVADPKAPATARERAARTLLEAQGVVGRRPGDGAPGGAARGRSVAAEDGPSPFAGLSAAELRAVGERLQALRARLKHVAESDDAAAEELTRLAAEVEAIKAGRADAVLPAGVGAA